MATLSPIVESINPAKVPAKAEYTPKPSDYADMEQWYAEIDQPLTNEEIDAMCQRHLAKEAAEQFLAENQTQSVTDAFFRGVSIDQSANAA